MVSNFNHVLWDNIVCSVAYSVLYQNFPQGDHAWRKRESTGRQILVEASASDHIWGAGMKVDNPWIKDPRYWSWSNILGWALMQDRSTLNHTLIQAAVAEADCTGEGWVDLHYVQQSHTRVRNYYLPCWQGPNWLNVHRVIHTCKLTREVVFDEEGPQFNQFQRDMGTSVRSPGRANIIVLLPWDPSSIKERSQGDEGVEASGTEAKLQ